jgi:hypothetical protein
MKVSHVTGDHESTMLMQADLMFENQAKHAMLQRSAKS